MNVLFVGIMLSSKLEAPVPCTLFSPELEEWNNVVKIFCAMCEAYEQSPTEMFQQMTPKETLHNVS